MKNPKNNKIRYVMFADSNVMMTFMNFPHIPEPSKRPRFFEEAT